MEPQEEDNRVIPITPLKKKPISDKKRAHLEKMRKMKKIKKVKTALDEKEPAIVQRVMADFQQKKKEFIDVLGTDEKTFQLPVKDILVQFQSQWNSPAADQMPEDMDKFNAPEINHQQLAKSKVDEFVADPPTVKHIADQQTRTENTSSVISSFNRAPQTEQGIVFL